MLTEMLHLVPALAAGVALGAMFFGGLWWTVRKGLASPNPALWFFASMMLRTAVALGGFFLVGGDDWRRWLACLVGFVAARLIVGRLTRGVPDGGDGPEREAAHAP
jgi:F1F0 ATPase subunit 2